MEAVSGLAHMSFISFKSIAASLQPPCTLFFAIASSTATIGQHQECIVSVLANLHLGLGAYVFYQLQK
jgi:uncharacterized membrane protein YdjX (TVP38/TMEM64 family)